MDEPGIEWHFTGQGWPGQAKHYEPEQMPSFYNSIDYVLVPAYYEGGPMSVLEALASGKEVIAPPIGFVQDYPHIQYNTGDAEDLRRVLRELVERRQRLRRTVAHRTWQAWAEDHDRLFRQLLRDGCPSAFNVSTVPARKNEHLRVLLATHAPENVTRGGPSIRVGKTAEELRKLGLLVDIVAEARPDPTGYDLVHVFNVWEPQAALEQLRHLRQFDVPIAFSPIYLDLSETAWTGRAVPRLFRQSDSPEVLKRYLDALADDSLLLDGSGRPEVLEIEPGYFASVKELVNLADHLIALGEREMRKLWATGVEPRPYTLVRNATEFDRFAKASAEPFVARYGVKDYVLCVGRLEHRKNQLLLVQALKDTGLPLVLVGQSLDPHYAELVRRHAESTVLFIDHLPHENDLLASAYAGARVFALPSWSEGAPLAALEAAAAGTALVLSNRSSEQEYFGDLARYCDPSSVESIRETVLEAYHKDARNKARRRRLQTLVRSQYTWGKAAKDTLAAYHRTLEQRARHAMPLPDVHPESVRRLEIGSGNTPQPGYEHLDIRSDLPHLEHVHDIAKPLPFPEATFDEILSRSSLEHVSWRHITEILRDWRRVLKPGGVLRIWMPDLEYLARTYLSGTTDQHLDPSYVSEAQRLLGEYSPSVWATIKMFGGQDYPDNFHAGVYDFKAISTILETAGFERVERNGPNHGLDLMAYRPIHQTTTLPAQANSGVLPTQATLPAQLELSLSPAATSSQKAVEVKWGGIALSFSGYSRLLRDSVQAVARLGVSQSMEHFWLDQRFLDFLKQHADRDTLLYWRGMLDEAKSGNAYICFHPPTNWKGINIYARHRSTNPGFKTYVGITMFETDRLPAGWADACNQMDEIWVPCRFNRESFARSGVDPERIQVVPFGMDASRYDPSAVRPMEIPGRRGFAFLSTFQWNKRKGWDVLLKAYLSAFISEDDVCLVLRSYPDRIKTPTIRERIDQYVRRLGHDPARVPTIILLEEFLSDEQMPTLYAAADAFVLPTRGEGWGIPFMEAMASALPTIATRWSSHLDFMNDENSYLIDVEGLVPVDPEQTVENPLYTADQQWAQPSVAHTAALMRHVFENREEARARGARARQDITQHWSLDRTANWIAERVAHLNADKPAFHRSEARQLQTTEPKSAGVATAQPLPVLWHGPIYDPSGYADEVRHFLLNLREQGIPVAARPIGRHSELFRAQLDLPTQQALDAALATQVGPGFVSVVHFPAYAFKRLPQAAYNVGRVMYETDGLPADWVAKCNEMDEIWVPTDFNVETFRRAGVTARLVKVPGGIDTERFRPGLDPLPIPGVRGTVFLSIFEWLYRKGWDVLLQAWAKAFRPTDDVTLVLRSYPANATDVPNVKEEIESRIEQFLREALGLRRDQVAPIVVLGEQIPEQEMPRLIAAAHAYVGPSRGEGWGRPQMEAMACGLPVIATRWSGNLEFMNDENCLLVDVEGLVDIDQRAEYASYHGQRWAEPSVDHLAVLLRKVVEQPEEMARIGRQARMDVVERWDWKTVAAIAAGRLAEIQSELGRRQVGIPRQGEKALAIRWEGSQFVHHSMALVNRELCLQLIEGGQEVSLIPYEPDQFSPASDPRFAKLGDRIGARLSGPADVHVRHQWPPNFEAPTEGHWVMIQPWEFGSIPTEWIEKMKAQVDEVWAYTDFVRKCYLESGMPADRVHVVPLGVDTARFRPDVKPLKLKTKKRFKLLFVGGTIGRKGPDVLLDAYINAFSAQDDVCLVIKDMGGKSFYRGQTAEETIRKIQAHPDAPEILYLTEDMPDSALPGLYTACDSLVHPYRGEGFGLPIAEAMACGLPVIVTGAGACLDFCDESVAYLIPAGKTQLPEKRIGRWETVDTPFFHEPDRPATARLMRHVFEHQEEARALGARAAQRIRERFTWRHVAERATERMLALRERPILRLQKEKGARYDELAATQEAMDRALAVGEAALQGGDLEAAAAAFARVVDQHADLAVGHAALATTLMALDRVEEALPALRRATELAPHAGALHNQLGVALFRTGDLQGAEAAFRDARRADRGDLQPLMNLIDLYREQERYEEATQALKDAVAIDPNHPEVLATFATICLELGDAEGAAMAVRRLEAAQPEHPDLGDLRSALGRVSEEQRHEASAVAAQQVTGGRG
ncbi:MAG: glycosyltransferase [Chloroflexota bacterium]